MDERQQQIRERAGLEESRLNTELIDFLRGWGTYILFAVAAIAGGYLLYQRWDQSKAAEINQAFVELDAALATGNPSPEALKQLAEQYEGIRGVPIMARLEAADAYMAAVRTGVRPGAVIGPDGKVENEQDLLADADRDGYLQEAASLYQQVLQDAERLPSGALHAIGALYGLAAVAESRGEMDAAKGHYERIRSLADSAGFPLQAKLAEQRIASLAQLAEPPTLLAEAQLPKLPWVQDPPPAPAPGTEESATGEPSAPPAGADPAAAPPADAPPAEGAPPAEPAEPAEPGEQPEPVPSEPK